MMMANWNQLCANLKMARADLADESVESDAEIDFFADAQRHAEWEILTTPAPDLEALAFKMEVFRDEEAYNLGNEAVREALNGMIADARRLTGREG